MSDHGLIALILVALVLSRFWKQVLPLLLSLLAATSILGLYQIAHFLHH